MTTYSAREPVDDDGIDLEAPIIVMRRMTYVSIPARALTNRLVSRDARLLYALMCVAADAGADDELDEPMLRSQMGVTEAKLRELQAELVLAGCLQLDNLQWTILEPDPPRVSDGS